MAKFQTTLTTALPTGPTTSNAYGTALLCKKEGDSDAWLGTVAIVPTAGPTGNFGGGTVTVELSFDQGATWYPAQNLSGTSLAVTAAANFNMTLGTGRNAGDSILMRGNLTGSTAGSVNFIVYTNLG